MEKEWQDILLNGAVLKQTVRESPVKPPMCPEYKQEVVVHCVGKTTSEPSRIFHNTRESNKPIGTSIGDQILDLLPPGLMLCVRMMSVGEIARVKLQSRYAFGLGGHWFGLEPNADVEYEVELLQIGDYAKEVPEMSLEELARAVCKCKERGNEFYKWAEYEKALRCYKEGVRYGDGLQQLEEQEKSLVTVDHPAYRDRVACLNNIATVLEKQGKLKEAMESTILVLEADPHHLKSLVRAARVAVLQGSHEEAEAAVAAGVSIAPTNDSVLKVKHDLEERVAKHKVLEKERWGGFLKPVSPEDVKKLREQEAEKIRQAEEQKRIKEETPNNGRIKTSNEYNYEDDDDDTSEAPLTGEDYSDKDSVKADKEKDTAAITARFLVLLFPSLIFLLLEILNHAFHT